MLSYDREVFGSAVQLSPLIPPNRPSNRRRLLRRTPKSVAGRYYQLLSGHAVIGPYLKDNIHKEVDDKCWWCGGGKKQTRHHLRM